MVSNGYLADATLAELLPVSEEVCRAVSFACLAKSLQEGQAEHDRLERARAEYAAIAAAVAELPPADRD